MQTDTNKTECGALPHAPAAHQRFTHAELDLLLTLAAAEITETWRQHAENDARHAEGERGALEHLMRRTALDNKATTLRGLLHKLSAA